MGWTVHKSEGQPPKPLCKARMRHAGMGSSVWDKVTCKNCLKRLDPDSRKLITDRRKEELLNSLQDVDV